MLRGNLLGQNCVQLALFVLQAMSFVENDVQPLELLQAVLVLHDQHVSGDEHVEFAFCENWRFANRGPSVLVAGVEDFDDVGCPFFELIFPVL